MLPLTVWSGRTDICADPIAEVATGGTSALPLREIDTGCSAWALAEAMSSSTSGASRLSRLRGDVDVGIKVYSFHTVA